MKKVIFVTGTGRCGTNILKEMFSKHSKVTTFPFELRFLTDPDGIFDFYSTASENWSPYIIDKRIERLDNILNEIADDKPLSKLFSKIAKYLHISQKRYIGWKLRKHLPHFYSNNNGLILKLHNFYYNGVYEGTADYKRNPSMFFSKWIPKEELTKIFKKYLKDLLSDIDSDYIVLDETWSLFFAREIVELIPNAKIIHIYRDPRDVIASARKQGWCPTDINNLIFWYESMISYWEVVKKSIPRESYREIKLETLVNSPEKNLKQLCRFIGLDFEEELLEVDLSKSNQGRWKKDFNTKEKRILGRMLKKRLEKFEYE